MFSQSEPCYLTLQSRLSSRTFTCKPWVYVQGYSCVCVCVCVCVKEREVSFSEFTPHLAAWHQSQGQNSFQRKINEMADYCSAGFSHVVKGTISRSNIVCVCVCIFISV